MTTRDVSRSAQWSSAIAPVALAGGWALAAARQRDGFDSVRETISALAARDADERWIMTSALLATGACHLVTAAGLRRAGVGGRVLLAVGGVATAGVAAAPLPSGNGSSGAHTLAAAISFGAFALWPAFSVGPTDRRATPPLRSGPARAAAGVLMALVGGFVVSLQRDELVGLTERVAALAEALWPLVVVRCLARTVHRSPLGSLNCGRARELLRGQAGPT